MKRVLSLISILILSLPLIWAQTYVFNTRIVDTKGDPIKGVMIESAGATAAVFSDEKGRADLVMNVPQAIVGFSCEGYFPVDVPISEKNRPGQIVLIPENWKNYSPVSSLNKKDMEQALSIDQAIQGNISGLQVVKKSGMPGEGAYLNTGGIHSLYAENSPLIVLNGVPYMNETQVSSAIKSYSRGLFNALNISDIRNISLLSGAEAAHYGSLGSNGVLLIETEQATSDNLDTRISLSGQYGLHFKARSVEVLDADEYKNYLRSIALMPYGQMGQLIKDYPFLQNSSDYPEAYIFNNNTNWQSEVYKPAMLSNTVFRVEGGDEIAKYNMSAGYSSDGGIVLGTRTERYHTLINSNIMVSRKIDIFTSVRLSYLRSSLQEQGMSVETNPLLAAWFKMPVLNPYFAGSDGKTTGSYAPYNFANINDYPLLPYENVSNPTAIVNTLDAKDKIYDVNIHLGFNYQIFDKLKLTGLFNRQYRYVEEDLFIPGVSNQAIYPQYYGIGRNTVRKAIAESRTSYYSLNAFYHNIFDQIHDLKLNLGGRIMTTSAEYDISSGFNTANDFYKTLDQTIDEEVTDGYISKWVWANYYLRSNYTWNKLLAGDLNFALDGSSVSGLDAPRYYLYPGGALTFMAGNLAAIPQWLNELNLSIHGTMSGNSRFSSNFAKNYYQSSNFFNLGSIIRGDIPNTLLEPEKQRQIRARLDMALSSHRVRLGAELFHSYAYDLIIPQNISSIYAADNYYENGAAVATQGLSLSTRLVPVETKQFSWTLGATITKNSSLVKDLGEQDYIDIAYGSYSEGEDAVIRLQVGQAPYQFYGYKTDGIYQSNQEALNDNYISVYGSKFQGGDVRFVDLHADGIINEQDKTLLGSTRPDYFGSFYTNFRFKQLSLNAHFYYSLGGKIYNAVRRELESMDCFHNQSKAVLNRWQIDNQQTDMPRAAYGDPSGNTIFSDRWVEDASYIKLGSISLIYTIDKPLGKLFHSGSIWISGENLLTFTHYLGNDPELAFSYDEALYGIDFAKVPNPKTVKIGFNLNF